MPAIRTPKSCPSWKPVERSLPECVALLGRELCRSICKRYTDSLYSLILMLWQDMVLSRRTKSWTLPTRRSELAPKLQRAESRHHCYGVKYPTTGKPIFIHVDTIYSKALLTSLFSITSLTGPPYTLFPEKNHKAILSSTTAPKTTLA